MSLQNYGDGRWYWKFLDQHGLFHYYNPHGAASWIKPLCGDRYIKEVSRPGTYGKETVVTCVHCLGTWVRITDEESVEKGSLELYA